MKDNTIAFMEEISQISVRPLQETDLEQLHHWLNAPHLYPHYMQEPISLEGVYRKFRPRIGGNHYCHPLIASCADVPFGYLQWYLNRSVPEYGVGTIGENDGVSFDYFIGDATYLGRGLGSAILVSAINLIVGSLDPKDRVFFMGHEPANTKAIRCSKRAGFVCQDQKEFMENGKCYQLFSYDLRDRDSE